MKSIYVVDFKPIYINDKHVCFEYNPRDKRSRINEDVVSKLHEQLQSLPTSMEISVKAERPYDWFKLRQIYTK